MNDHPYDYDDYEHLRPPSGLRSDEERDAWARELPSHARAFHPPIRDPDGTLRRKGWDSGFFAKDPALRPADAPPFPKIGASREFAHNWKVQRQTPLPREQGETLVAKVSRSTGPRMSAFETGGANPVNFSNPADPTPSAESSGPDGGRSRYDGVSNKAAAMLAGALGMERATLASEALAAGSQIANAWGKRALANTPPGRLVLPALAGIEAYNRIAKPQGKADFGANPEGGRAAAPPVTGTLPDLGPPIREPIPVEPSLVITAPADESLKRPSPPTTGQIEGLSRPPTDGRLDGPARPDATIMAGRPKPGSRSDIEVGNVGQILAEKIKAAGGGAIREVRHIGGGWVRESAPGTQIAGDAFKEKWLEGIDGETQGRAADLSFEVVCADGRVKRVHINHALYRKTQQRFSSKEAQALADIWVNANRGISPGEPSSMAWAFRKSYAAERLGDYRNPSIPI